MDGGRVLNLSHRERGDILTALVRNAGCQPGVAECESCGETSDKAKKKQNKHRSTLCPSSIPNQVHMGEDMGFIAGHGAAMGKKNVPGKARTSNLLINSQTR